ncbi:MAG: tannase/feruloyl esterase family alpha/beta hydrolase [Hydrogenophaga sp.]|nr:tannase/feruloyl esterase family alpha/beta hydrolase [Hydrogenophaga sp.]
MTQHALFALGTTALLMGCASQPRPAPAPTAIAPVMACEHLAQLRLPASAIALPTRGARITSAQSKAPTEARPHPSNGTWLHALPAYCEVKGEIDPVDRTAPVIQFQLNVPTVWNGRAMHIGGGGLNGNIPANLAVVAASGSPVSAAMPPDVPYPLTRGYALFGGDSGHQGPAGEWALNDEAWLNFAHAGLKKTRDAAVAVLTHLHGQRPRTTYFMGTSQGGREALEVAQRYPDDYAGVMANVPLIGYSAHVVAKTIFATLQTGEAWISPAAAVLIAQEVMRQCDALDGLEDGVISHYRGCNALFAAERGATPYRTIRCVDGASPSAPAGSPARCLSDAQIAMAVRMRSPTAFGFPLAHGHTALPAYGTGREHSGWLNITPQPKVGERPSLGQPGTTVQYGILKDPALNLLDFRLAAHRERIQADSELIDSTNPDLSRFLGRGGKLIIKSSSSDYAVNPQMLTAWYEAVVARHGPGALERHLRYYVLPNTGHAGDGASLTTGKPIPSRIDMIKLLTDWVEHDRAPPDAPVGATMDPHPPFTVRATKPMCRFPLYPRYVGHGNPDRAESYACQHEATPTRN